MASSEHLVPQFELKPGVEYVKIHGLQRSGTNYITSLINGNFVNVKSLVNAGGWKHGHYCAPWTLGREVHVVVVVKSPYSWLVSLYDYLKPGVPFDKFVRSPVVLGEGAGTPYLLMAKNPVQHWNSMNFHWKSIKMVKKKVVIAPYEIALHKPESALDGMASEFGLTRKDEDVHVSEKTLTAGGEEPMPTPNTWGKRDYYLKADYMKTYTPELLQFVKEQLEGSVMRSLGY